MVILDADHPDVEDFVWCKAIEERKARALRDAGFDMDLDGADSHSIQYQNANNSVRRPTSSWRPCRRARLGPHGPDGRRGGADGEGSRPVPPDSPLGLGVRRPGPAVRHHDQPLAHGTHDGPDQRLQPVLGVRAPRQLGLQPRLHEPDDVPRRERRVRRGRLQGGGVGGVDRGWRSSWATPTTRPRASADGDVRLPPARHRLRQPGVRS